MAFLSVQNPEKTKEVEVLDDIFSKAIERSDGILFEQEAYEVFKFIGLSVPEYFFFMKGSDISAISKALDDGKRYVAKAILNKVSHKTEIGGILFDITRDNAVETAAHFAKKFSEELNFEGVLFAEQISYDKKLGGELLFGLYQDPFFKTTVALGFGGTSTEYLRDVMKENAAQIFLPACVNKVEGKRIASQTPVVKMLTGNVRGYDKVIDVDSIYSVIDSFASLGRLFSQDNESSKFIIDEMEINPAVVSSGKIIALDGVIKVKVRKSLKVENKPLSKIQNLLEPKSVAIAGASGKNKANPSNIILKKFLKSGIEMKNIYLIHPKEDEIEGVKCVKSVDELLQNRGGRPVDCLVVGVPAKIAYGLISEAMDKGAANSMQIISAGFGETKSGKQIESDLKEKLASLSTDIDRRPVINGPNTLGNIYHSCNTLFTPRYKSSGSKLGKKNAALICQSGAYMITRISDLADRVAPSISVSVGNQMDLSVADFFEFLMKEEGINAYGLYIEGLNVGDGIRLMDLIEKAKEQSKFAIIYKAGRTEAGMEAAKGHTAAMAGDYGMFKSMMENAGGIVADSFAEFDDLMMLVSLTDGLKGLHKNKDGIYGVAMLSNAGFEKCALTDHLTSGNFETFKIAQYTENTKKALSSIMEESGIASIIDQGNVLDLSPMMNDEGYEKVIRATLADEMTSFGIYAIVPETAMLNTCEVSERHREDISKETSILNRFIAIKKDADKPFVISIESGKQYDGFAQKLIEAGIPTFRSADSAARTVAKLLA